MKNSLLLVAILVVFPTAAHAAGDLFVHGGQKVLDRDWAPVDKQIELGAEISVGPGHLPIAAAAGVSRSSGTGKSGGISGSGQTTEFYGGARLVVRDLDHLLPYAEAGLMATTVRTTAAGNTVSVTGGGYWGAFGVMLRGSSPITAGAQLRFSRASGKYEGQTVELGAVQARVMVGISWPSVESRSRRTGQQPPRAAVEALSSQEGQTYIRTTAVGSKLATLQSPITLHLTDGTVVSGILDATKGSYVQVRTGDEVRGVPESSIMIFIQPSPSPEP